MKTLLLLLLIFLSFNMQAQESLTYQKPTQEILDLVDVEFAPSVLMDEAKEYMVLISRNPYKTIDELSNEELR